MKFGKELQTHQEETLPEWRDKFLCYKPLKKLLKNLPATAADSFPPDHIPFRIQQLPINDAGALDGQDQPVIGLQEWFVRILNEELEKFNDFYVDKEEEFVIRFQELKERIDKLKKKSSRGVALTSESEFSREMMDIRKDLVTIHGEMVLLKNYSSLNFAGLIKILKKHDKRTGGLLCLPFTQLALHQPFFTTEPLTRLVRVCEANLELLFPMQAEIIESDPNPDDRTSPSLNGTTNSSYETPTLGEETMEVYRSTLAAMRTIRGLQKASSSYNPLSFSAIFGNQNRESGTATAEDSASRSPAALPKG